MDLRWRQGQEAEPPVSSTVSVSHVGPPVTWFTSTLCPLFTRPEDTSAHVSDLPVEVSGEIAYFVKVPGTCCLAASSKGAPRGSVSSSVSVPDGAIFCKGR